MSAKNNPPTATDIYAMQAEAGRKLADKIDGEIRDAMFPPDAKYDHRLDALGYATMAMNRKLRRAKQAAAAQGARHSATGVPPTVVVKAFTKKLAAAMNKPGMLTTLAKANDGRVIADPNTRLMKLLGVDYVKNILTSKVQQDFRTDEWLLQVIRLDGGRLVVPFTRVADTGMRFSADVRAQLVLFLS